MTEITYEAIDRDVASRSFKVSVPVDRVAAAERRAVKEYSRRVRLPGFRKGHAPEPVIRRRFGPEIRQFVLREAVRDGWERILKEADLKPIADPNVGEISYEQNQPIEFEMRVEVRPELELGTVGGFELTRRVDPVDDAAIDEVIEEERATRGTWVPAESSDVRAGPGDLVSITVENLTSADPGSPPEPHRLVLGQGQAIPDLEDRIMTLAPEETIETEVSLPDERAAESDLGTSRRVRLTLHEVKHRELSALDDEFANTAFDQPSMAEARVAIRSRLEAEAETSANRALRRQLIERIATANQVKAPPSLVARGLAAYAEHVGVEPEGRQRFQEKMTALVVEQVLHELIIESVATAQNLRASDADVDGMVSEMAARTGDDPGKLYVELDKLGRIDHLRSDLTEKATLEWLLEQSTVTEAGA